MKAKQIFIVSLGCAKNWLDTEIMAGTAVMAGMQITPNVEEADLFMINTCSFIFDARTEAEENIREAIAWKAEKPGRYIVVTGCLPQRDIDETVKLYPTVDLFMGLNEVDQFAKLVTKMFAGDTVVPEMKECTYIYDENTPRLQLTPQNYAYLKIAEGCNHNCAFCAIPDIRGYQRSRPIESIVKEAKNLIDNGVYEIILIAQDTTYYGKELKDGTTIVKLMEALDQIEGDFKLRMLYTHPAFFKDDVIDMFANSKHLLPYIDIPLQHSSDRLLKEMRRPTTEAKTRALLTKIKEKVKDATIRTTFIVGYPGETEADYQNLKQFILDMEFDRMGVFAYSPEVGTDAATYTDRFVDPEVAQARADELMKLQSEIAYQKNLAKVGTTIEVFIDGMDDDFILGRSFGDAPEVDNIVLIEYPQEDCELLPMVKVKITSAETYELVGELV